MGIGFEFGRRRGRDSLPFGVEGGCDECVCKHAPFLRACLTAVVAVDAEPTDPRNRTLEVMLVTGCNVRGSGDAGMPPGSLRSRSLRGDATYGT